MGRYRPITTLRWILYGWLVVIVMTVIMAAVIKMIATRDPDDVPRPSGKYSR